jgi:hypothetical protein
MAQLKRAGRLGTLRRLRHCCGSSGQARRLQENAAVDPLLGVMVPRFGHDVISLFRVIPGKRPVSRSSANN